MKITTSSSRANEAALDDPVFIMEQGKPARALLHINTESGRLTLADALAQPGRDDFDFDPPRVGEIALLPDGI